MPKKYEPDDGRSNFSLLRTQLKSRSITDEQIALLALALVPPPELYLVFDVCRNLARLIRKHGGALPHWCPISDLESLLEVLDTVSGLKESEVPDHWHHFHARQKKRHHLNGACFTVAPLYVTLLNKQEALSAREGWERLMFMVWGTSVSLVQNIESGESISHLLMRREQLGRQSSLFKQTSSRFYSAMTNSCTGLRLLSEGSYWKVVEELGGALGSGGRDADLQAIKALDLSAYETGAKGFDFAIKEFVRLGSEFGADPIERSDRNRPGWPSASGGISVCGYVGGSYRTLSLNSGWGHTSEPDGSHGEESESFDIGGWDRAGFNRDHSDAIATEYASGSSIVVDFPRNASAFLDEGQNETGWQRNASIKSLYGAIARHRAKARNNQAFHWAWKELTAAELAFVQAWLDSAKNELGAEYDNLVVLVASVLGLGRPARALRNAWVTHSANPQGTQAIEYVLDQQLWRLKISPPAYSSIDIDEEHEESPAVHQTSDRLLLPDLFGIHRFIAPLAENDAESDDDSGRRPKAPYKKARLIPRNRQKIRELERAFHASCPKQMRLGTDRLAHPLRSHLLSQSRDVAVPALICEDNSLHGQTVRHYNTLPIADVQASYIDAAACVFGQAAKPPSPIAVDEIKKINDTGFRKHVGSKLLPRTDYVRGVVADLKQKIRDNARQNSAQSVRNYSNFQTLYLGFWMATALALRGRVDPWPCSVNLEQKFAVVNDKERFEGFGVRLGHLPDGLCAQMEHHLSHRKRLALNAGIDPSRLEALGFPRLPIILDGTGNEIVALSPSMYADMIGLQFPFNSMRRYTRTHLKTTGAPGEWIDAYMGHWQNGMSPYDRYASMSPMDVLDALRPLLDDMLDSLGFEPVY